MKIAVIVPAYNAADYLPHCLNTLMAQTRPVDVFCCDDGSTDGTAAILDAYAAKHPNLHVRHRQHLGMVATYNQLLDELPSEYEAFGIVDADDYVHPEMFGLLAEAMERTNADLAECEVRCVPAASRPPDGLTDEGLDPRERVFDDLSHGWLHRTRLHGWARKWNKLYRRRAIGGLRFRAGLDYEDDIFFASEVCAAIRRKVLVPRRLYGYRDSPTSMNGRFDIRRYVSSVALRLRLSCETFLVPKRIPAELEAEWRCDLVKDAYRMLVRKNLKKNRNGASRRELFRAAGRSLGELRRDFGLGFDGLNPIQRAMCVCCERDRYHLARVLAVLT